MKINGFAWAGIGTDRFEETLHFFTGVLHLDVEFLGEKVAHLTVGEGQMLEIFGEGEARELHSIPTIGFEVEDFDQAREGLIAAGVELVGEVGRWNGHEWQHFRGPDGHLFEIKKTAAAAQ